MAGMLQPQIILLKEGTDTSQGKAQLVSNINACCAVTDVVRTTLGPRGMDKLIHDERGNTTISNDGATIMKLLDIVHPAAKILVDIAKSQDSEVGDGTTTVVLLAGEFLREAKPFIEDGVHPQNLIRSYRKASQLATEKIKELAFSIEGKSLEEKKELIAKCAATTLSSKLIGGEKDFFASMVVEAVIAIGNDDRLNLIGIKRVPGGTMRDSFLVNGVAFKKTFSYAGFEQQPKKFMNPKILLLNIELELKFEKENAEIRLSDPSQYQSIVDAEWNIIYDKLDKCVQSGAKIVLSRLVIGDLATQYFADRDIFCAGRVTEEDLQRVAAASGGLIGLAAATVGLTSEAAQHLRQIVPPVLNSFCDQDSRVRYYACEALYNIAKVVRGDLVVFFKKIFDALCKLSADSDANVQSAAHLLDRLVKDIITESDQFSTDEFIPLLRERMNVLNPYVRQFLVGWITVLDSVPDIDMLGFLPDFLDGLFNMLSDSSHEIRQQADSALSEFLQEIKNSPSVDYGRMAEILVQRAGSPDEFTRQTAITWINEFVKLGGDQLVPYYSDILGAILPCISDKEEKIRVVAQETNEELRYSETRKRRVACLSIAHFVFDPGGRYVEPNSRVGFTMIMLVFDAYLSLILEDKDLLNKGEVLQGYQYGSWTRFSIVLSLNAVCSGSQILDCT